MSDHDASEALGLSPSSATEVTACPSVAVADGPAGHPPAGDGDAAPPRGLPGPLIGDIPAAPSREDRPRGPDSSCHFGPFPSVAALRWRHAELSQQLRDHDGTEPGPWDAIRAFISFTCATGAVLEKCDDRSVAQAILNHWSSALYRNGQGDIDAVLAPFAEPETGHDLERLNLHPCPYKGLDSFDEGDRENFLGRWRCVKQAVDLLTENRFLAVVGATGRGKTSLVRAGLLPALREDTADGRHWRVLAPMMAGPGLLDRLVRAVRLDRAADPQWVAEQAAEVARDAGHLARLAGGPGERPVVLAVDRLEEAFASAGDAELQDFFEALSALVRADGPPHSIVLIMRWEDTPRVTQFSMSRGLFEASQLVLEPPAPDDLREMIEGPARRVGLVFEAGIVDRLIRDVIGDPWALALLQFALVRLWEARPRESIRITWEVYNRALGEGGARDAIRASSDRFYQRDLSEDEQVIAREVLVRLVRTGAGRELGRMRVPLADLGAAAPRIPGQVRQLARKLREWAIVPSRPGTAGIRGPGAGAARAGAPEVIDKLHRAGLVRVRPGDDGRPVVELANEAILDKWPMLAGWVYQAHREADLATERRRNRRRSRLRLVGVGVLAVLGLLMISAYLMWERAKFQTRVAVARKLIDYTYAYRSIDLDLSLLFGLKAHELADQFGTNGAGGPNMHNLLQGEARNALLFILNSNPRLDKFLLSGQDPRPRSVVAQSSDGRAFALAIKADETHYRIALWRRRSPGSGLECIEFGDGAGAPGPIYGLAFRPDGKVLASAGGRVQTGGGFRSQVILWDVDSGPKPVKLFEPSEPNTDRAEVLAVAFSADGTKLATAGKDRPGPAGRDGSPGIVRLWDVTHPGRPELIGKSDRGHRAPGESAERMLGLAFSRDGKTLVSGGGAGGKNQNGDHLEGEIAVWDLETFPRREARRLPVKGGGSPGRKKSYAVCGLALYQPDGDRARPPLIAAGCLDGAVALIDLADPGPTPHFLPESGETRHRAFVRSLAFSDDGKRLATGGNGGAVIVWDLGRLQAVDKPMLAHPGDIQSLVFEERGAYLRSAARDETWVRWNLTTPNGLARRLPVSDGPVAAAAFHPGGALLATAGEPAERASPATEFPVRLWDLADEGSRPIKTLDGHHGRVLDLAFSPDGDILATGGVDRKILLWNVRKGAIMREDPAILRSIKDAHGGRITCVRFKPPTAGRGRVLASASDDGTVKFWDVSEPRTPRPLNGIENPSRYPVSGLEFSPDGRTLATAHWEKIIRLWDVSLPGKPRATLIGHEDAVLCLAFSPDGQWLASGGKDNLVLLWRIDGDRRSAKPEPFDIRFHRRPVRSVAFSPDGRWLASASEDEGANLHLWDTQELSRRHFIGPQLSGHVGTVRRVACSDLPGGRSRLVSAGDDGAILIWDLSAESWVKQARKVANRELTTEEKHTFEVP